MKRSSGGIFALAVLLALVGLALAARLFAPGTEAPRDSVGSSEPDGRRALFLILEELSFRVGAWREPPGSLPHEDAVLWLARPPQHERAPADRKDAADSSEDDREGSPSGPGPETKPPRRPSPASTGMLSLAHYRRFVEEGGTLVLRAGADTRSFLVDVLGIAACAEIERSQDAKAGARTFRNESGEELDVEVGAKGLLRAPREGSALRGSWSALGGDEVLAAVVPLGRGRIVVLGDDAFLQNARIGELDHALFAVRLAEELARGKRILFDEYALGLWEARSPVAVLASPAWFLGSVNALLLLVLLVVRSAWVREFPRDPAPLESASPLLRARSLAGLLVRAGRFELLAGFLRDGARKRSRARVGATATSVSPLERTPCGSLADLERLQAEISALERARS